MYVLPLPFGQCYPDVGAPPPFCLGYRYLDVYAPPPLGQRFSDVGAPPPLPLDYRYPDASF